MDKSDIVKIFNDKTLYNMILWDGEKIQSLLVYKDHRGGTFNHVEIKYMASAEIY